MNGYSRRERDEVLGVVPDPFARNALRAAYHLRRFLVIYVCGTLAALGLALLPTLAGGGRTTVSAGSTGGSPYSSSGGAAGQATRSAGRVAGAASNPAASLSAASGTSASRQSAAGSAAGAGSGASSAAGSAIAAPSGGQIGSGVTVAGVPCRPGVRQIPYSQYAAPCVSRFSGNNGGATWRGVTGNTITIAIRHTSDANGANSLAVEAEVEAAGGVSYSTAEGYTKKMVAYWNKVMELYGRQIRLVDFNGQGNYTNEETDTGQAAACADADAVANTLHAFGEIDFEGNYETAPFSQCAARYGLYIPEGAAYFPESYYQQLNPYVWGVAMNCTLVSDNYAEFAIKQLFDFPTKWAGSDGALPLNGNPRKIATYIPNNAGYQSCAQQAKQVIEQHGVASNRMDQYNYALDISTFPQDAQRAIVQFSANRDTSVLLACDPISPIFLTQDAVQQNYYPEWVLEGVALTDTDSFAQLWDQRAIDGHLFGLSQAGSTAALLSPSGEAGRFLTAAGVPINPSSVVDYYELLPMFNQLQAAGPRLTPANIGAGSAALPPGGSDFTAEGPWYFGSGHTLIRGSRQVFWEGTQRSQADGKVGTYVSLAGGRFYQPGQYPTGAPGFYP